ncbi:hypothetical protein DFQ28_011746 [Apophysomyces sp. BC1034]|nr:hypothetical protein DFQ30_000230 [Apophysomyces sp. BC1015]KAG0168459.1 hypothetical protein DFQ29_010142 [Apophysomyces sp. BC1021]KAG0184125.1 hypothetical protein DFQ28_011746 [Apophysomyces sp. BC1034]
MKLIGTLSAVAALSTLVAASPEIYTTKYTYINGVKIAALVDGVDSTVTGTLVINDFVTSTYTRPHAAFRWNFPLLQALIKLPGIHAILSKFRILSHIAHAIEPEFFAEMAMQAQSADPNDNFPALLQAAAEKAAALLEDYPKIMAPQAVTTPQIASVDGNPKPAIPVTSQPAPAVPAIPQAMPQPQSGGSVELSRTPEAAAEMSQEPQTIEKDAEAMESAKDAEPLDSATRQADSSFAEY